MSRNTVTKDQLDSIKYEDILKLRQAKEKHAIKVEDLEMTLKTADEYLAVMQDFLESVGFSSERIDSFECRRRDGYFPHSYNKGGLEGIAYRDQFSACENTGFENTDSVLERYAQYNLESFAEDAGLDPKNYSEWTEDQLEQWYEYESSDSSENTIEFQVRVMMTSETTAHVDFYVSASDSPYHRESDDKLELEIEFKSSAGMKRKLAAILKSDFVKCLTKNLREAF